MKKKKYTLYLDSETVKKARHILERTVPKLSLSQKVEEHLVRFLFENVEILKKK